MEGDREIVQKILEGDREHFNVFYETYYPRVYHFALEMVGDADAAEDLTQEVFVTVFRTLHTVEGKSDLGAWIFATTRNVMNQRAQELERLAREHPELASRLLARAMRLRKRLHEAG